MNDKVIKKSGKSFKSGLYSNTVESVVTNPKTGRIGFSFIEDDSIVDCRKLLVVNAEYEDITQDNKKRHVLATPENALNDFSDYDISITKQYQTNEWMQEITLNYGHDAEWCDGVKGTEAIKLIDDGNGFNMVVDDEDHHFDYSQWVQIYALMEYYFNHSGFNTDAMSLKFSKIK